LARTVEGFKDDLRTSFYDGVDRESIIRKLVEDVGYSAFEEMEEIDHDEERKIGPFSIMLPWSQRKDDVRKYWNQSFNPQEDALSRAYYKVRDLNPIASIRPSDFSTAYGLMPKNTSLGLPEVTRDKRYAAKYLHRAQQIRVPDDIYPCILYWRGQSAGLRVTPKQRVVWGFDHAETILGATILYPLIRVLRDKPGFSAWLGDVFVDEGVTRILNKARGRRIISMDFSGFDSSLSGKFLDLVDSILGSWFNKIGDDRVHLLGQISNTVGIVVPYDVWEGRTGGMPSGSVLTNMRDTIANLLAGYYVGYRAKSELIDYEVLGDDSVYLFRNDMDALSLSKFVKELGLVSNPDKMFVSTRSCHYLQRWHSLDHVDLGVSRGCRSPFRALSGMTGKEHWFKEVKMEDGTILKWNKYMETARLIMQVEC
jgi:hypothetical protein